MILREAPRRVRVANCGQAAYIKVNFRHQILLMESVRYETRIVDFSLKNWHPPELHILC